MSFKVRFYILQAVAYLSLVGLGIGLFHVQVMQGAHFRKTSERNRIRLIRLEAPRGNIYDRNGVLLATNRPSYNVFIIPEDFDPKDMQELERLLNMTESEIRGRMAEVRGISFTPVLLKPDITKELAMQIEERRPRLSGVFILVRANRFYPLNETGSHLVGYIGKITQSEYEQADKSVYHLNSWLGRSGIEKYMDSALRGEDGGRQLEVNARGVPIRLLNEREAVSGTDVQLTMDAELDHALRALFEEKKGAILVMDLETGGILAAVSNPAFDPNAFVSQRRNDERVHLIGSKDRPLFDRGFSGLYPPGSTFKLVTAMAALDSGLITPHTTFNCPGYFQFNSRSRRFKCWFHEGHGKVDLYRAIERSCNVYFYNIGRLLGEKRISEYARRFGFGSESGLVVPTASGLVPDAKWKKLIYKDEWYAGETISLAIGQSYLLVSPLQVLQMVAAIATDGAVQKPVILKNQTKEHIRNSLNIKQEMFKVLRQAMLKVVESNYGTGQLARVDFGRFGAKTGTAQAPPGEPHAWFTGFFPYEHPKIAMVVFVERGESGGLTSAKIAKQVVSIWNQNYGTAVS